MDNFHVEVTCRVIANFPYHGLPIRNLTIRNMFVHTKTFWGLSDKYNVKLKVLVKFLGKFATSIENLTLIRVVFKSSEQFYELLKNLYTLKVLKVFNCDLKNPGISPFLFLPNLRCISFNRSSKNFLSAFESLENLEMFTFSIKKEFFYEDFHQPLCNLLEKVPNIQHLSLESSSCSTFFELGPFNFKLKKLDAFSLTFDWTHPQNQPRLSFFAAQKGYLKELSIWKLPYDYDGGEILRFIFEEMNLEEFVVEFTTLIRNGRKVESIDQIQFMESQIKSGLELLRQFPGNIVNS